MRDAIVLFGGGLRAAFRRAIRRDRSRIGAVLGEIEEMTERLDEIGGAVAETGKQKCDHPFYVGVVGQVGSGEIVLGAHGAETGPILAKQRALIGKLLWMPGPDRHAVGSGEQHRRRLGGTKAREQAVLCRVVGEAQLTIVADVGMDWPFERAGRLRDPVGERIYQQGSAQIGCGIAEMTSSPKGDFLGVRNSVRLFVIGDRARVTFIFRRSVEC